jgi:GNAT superfamily N-acetyltransferase
MTMAGSITLREAIESDLPAILALLAQPALESGGVPDLAAARGIFARMKNYPSYRLFGAERDGALVGTYALLVMENLAHGGTPSAIVEQVMVAPDQQGFGVGTAMMRHALEQARNAGCYKVTLSSSLKRAGAHAFYDGLGFARHGYSFLTLLDGEGAA